MSVILGSDFEVYVDDVATSPPTEVPVHEMNNFQRSTQRDSQSFPVFMNPIAHNIPGARVVSGTLSGFLGLGDAGQDILRDAEINDTPVHLKILWDGTNGFEQDFKVGSTSQTATPGATLQETSFELLGDGVATIVGLGPLP